MIHIIRFPQCRGGVGKEWLKGYHTENTHRRATCFTLVARANLYGMVVLVPVVFKWEAAV